MHQTTTAPPRTATARLGALLGIAVMLTSIVASPTARDATAAAPPSVTNPEAFVRAAYDDFLGRAPTDAELAATVARPLTTAAQRERVVWDLSRSDEWIAGSVQALYQNTLGRPADAGGLAYWVGVLQSERASTARVAAHFYASTEYFTGIGQGRVDTWVTDLYVKILGRQPDAGGLAYWVDQTTRRGRVPVAYDIYQSVESRRTRVTTLYAHLLGRSPDTAGMTYWVARIRTLGDLTLSAALASSAEYYAAAPNRFVTAVASPPGAPTDVTAVAGTGQATVTWQPPADNGGAPVTGYVVTATPGGNRCTTTTTLTCTVTGLPEETTHTFTVTATNIAGTGPVSAPSNPVIHGTGAWQSINPVPLPARWSPRLVNDDGLIVGTEVDTATGKDRLVWCAAPCTSGTELQPLIVPSTLRDLTLNGLSPSGTVAATGYGPNGNYRGLVWSDPTAPPLVLEPSAGFEWTAIGGLTADGTIVGTEGNTSTFTGRGTVWSLQGDVIATMSAPEYAPIVQLVGGSSAHGYVGSALKISMGPTLTYTQLYWASPTAPAQPLAVPGDRPGLPAVAMSENGVILAGQDSVWLSPDTVPVKLSLPTGATGVAATALSDDGDAVGSVVSGGTRRAVVWTAPDTPVVLAGPVGVTDMRATGMAASGTVVGTGLDADGEKVALRWTGPSDENPEILRTAAQGQGPTIRALTGDGKIVGTSGVGSFLWSSPSATPVEIPGPVGATAVTVTAVAPDGQAAGNAKIGTSTALVGQYWPSLDTTPTALTMPSGVTSITPFGITSTGDIATEGYVWAGPDATPTALPIMSGTTSFSANAMNNVSTIIGKASRSNILDPVPPAFLVWATPGSVPMTLTSSGPDVTITGVDGISDDGTIVGTQTDPVLTSTVVVWPHAGASPVTLDTSGLTAVSRPVISPGGQVAVTARDGSGDLVVAIWQTPQATRELIGLPASMLTVDSLKVNAAGTIAISGTSALGHVAYLRHPA